MFNTLYYGSWGISPLAVVGIGVLAGIVMIAVIILKGLALWHAARRSEKWWFIVLLVVNTIGILDLVYLIAVVGYWHKFKDSGTAPTGTTPKV